MQQDISANHVLPSRTCLSIKAAISSNGTPCPVLCRPERRFFDISERARVLIVVDDALAASSLSDVLGTIGCEVTGIAAAVKDALCLAKNTKPDLALMHVRLAGQRNGIKGAELLQRQFGLPVILLTGEVDKETVRRAAKLTRWITRSSHQSHLHDSRAQT